LKLRSIGRSQEQLKDSFTPIDLDNIFDDNNPISLWLSEKKPLAFEKDEFPWLNVDEQEEDDAINIEDYEDRQLSGTPPFRYTVNQPYEGTHNSGFGDDLTPRCNRDGSGGGGEFGDGGDGVNGGAHHVRTSQSSRPSSRDINTTMSDHNDRRGQSMKNRQLRILIVALEKPRIKQPVCLRSGNIPPSFILLLSRGIHSRK